MIVHTYRLHTVTEKLDHNSHIDKYLLIIDPTEMDDAAEYTCKVGNKSTSARLIVDEGKETYWLRANR